MKIERPQAMLLDLDDTILAFEIVQAECWAKVLKEYSGGIGEGNLSRLEEQISIGSKSFWSDSERHRVWRQKLDEARRLIVEEAFSNLGLNNRVLAQSIADRYSVVRDEAIYPLPGAIETLLKLRKMKISLALVTNGSAAYQRRKIERFGIGQLFDKILIEGEQGFGKPDERIYRKALDSLGAEPAGTLMAGDNLLWDVITPQKFGIRGIWVNSMNKKIMPSVEPFLTVGSLSDVMNFL